MASLRPRGADDLGLRHALSDRLLPALVGAMVFLAALTGAATLAAAQLAAGWRSGAGSLVTMQVPSPETPAPGGGTRGDAAARLLSGVPGAAPRRLTRQDVATLLQPWLGEQTPQLSALMPAVFELASGQVAADLAARLQVAAPGSLVEQNSVWFDRLAALATSLQDCAALALTLVGFVAIAVIAVATRAGLAARRDAIEVVHGLGAADGTIAGQFAARVTLLAGGGGLLGVLACLPVLAGLTRLAAPFQPAGLAPAGLGFLVPRELWLLLVSLPLLAAAVGWVTTQAAVRLWLARLP